MGELVYTNESVDVLDRSIEDGGGLSPPTGHAKTRSIKPAQHGSVARSRAMTAHAHQFSVGTERC